VEKVMDLRSSKVCQALLLGAAFAVVPLTCAAQAASAGSRLPGPSRVDLYGGYAYFHPVNSSVDGYTYEPITMGAVASATGYFGNHFGVQAEGQFSPHGPDDCFYAAQAGPVYRRQYGRLVPFAHALFGGARVGGPGVQPCTWGYGGTAGVGVDYVLPYVFLRNRVALRVVQADYEYARVDFGANTAPTFINGGVGTINAYRLSAGVVVRLGDMTTAYPAALGCEVQPVQIYPGDPINVTSKVINLDADKRLKPVYSWNTSGGKITGSGEGATIATAGLAPGEYTVNGRVSEGGKPSQHADCSATFRVQGYEPPTLACSANPSSILPGGFSTITAVGRSPQNRTLNYSYGTTAGEITGTGTTGTLTAADVSPGVITVTCNVVDDLGLSAKATTTVTVVAPPAPPAPTARALCSVSFERDRRRPVRVDNEAKGCLDDIALELNREADALLVIVGKHDPEEKPDAAAERTLNIKQYLTEEKGIDASRIEVRTGESTGRTADNILVPPGATWDPGGTTSFDPTRVKRTGEPYAPGAR
jgi:hypothetical protein